MHYKMTIFGALRSISKINILNCFVYPPSVTIPLDFFHTSLQRSPADDVNLIGDDIRTIERNADVLLNACKDIGLAVNI